jgi:ABC-type transporter MlaC component
MPTLRYQVRKATHGGWYVYDTQTGGIWPGLVRVGAVQLAAHLNRRNP